MKVKYTTKRTGATYEQINEAVVKEFAAAVLADHKATPEHFAGQGRKGRTPFKRTGALVEGFYFKPASRSGAKSGLIGTIRAPLSRFASDVVRLKFIEYLHKLWGALGVGFTKEGL